MKTPTLLLASIPLLVLNSCSTIKETAAQIKDGTIAAREPKLRLTKADPSRFLPEGTSAEKVLSKNAPVPATKKETRLLAKNTLPTKKITSSPPVSKKTVKTKTTKTPKEAVAEVPYIELPPLPEASTNDNKGFRGILPSLDGNNEDTFIDIDGKALELPPMEIPELEEETNTEAPA